jgi:hypothetical protein
VDTHTRTAIGITVFNFSLLAQRTEMGSRSFALSGLAELSPERRELALSLPLSTPVSDFLSISAYSPAGSEASPVPISSLLTDRITAQAA